MLTVPLASVKVSVPLTIRLALQVLSLLKPKPVPETVNTRCGRVPRVEVQVPEMFSVPSGSAAVLLMVLLPPAV